MGKQDFRDDHHGVGVSGLSKHVYMSVLTRKSWLAAMLSILHGFML